MTSKTRTIRLVSRGYEPTTVRARYVRYLGTMTRGDGGDNLIRERWAVVPGGVEFDLYQEDDARRSRETRRVRVDAQTAEAVGMRPRRVGAADLKA